MDLHGLMQRRHSQWARLNALLDRIDRYGIDTLSRDEVNEFFGLYRLVSSDLNLVTTRTANPSIIEYLEALVARAYVHLTPPRRIQIFHHWWVIIRDRFPRLIRRESALLALSTGIFAAAAAFAFVATLVATDTVEIFLPAEHLSESPSDRVRDLEALERAGKSRVDTGGKHAAFTTFLFTHNIKVSCLAFALGFTFGIGTVAVLIMNGAMLGSLAARYYEDGVLGFFIAWVGPHGAIELPCVFFAGMAGLMIARAQFRRDKGPLTEQLREMRGDLADIIVGFSTLLVIAGIVEGGFSQINEPTISYELKQAVAAILFIFLLGYLFVMRLPKQEKSSATDVR